jgi:membrane-associated protease RseP (regulator of RpoE activity)
MHRFLLCAMFFWLAAVVAAPAAQRATDGNNESWVFSSDEAGGGTSYLGVDIADVTTERLSDLKLKEEHGAEITMVDQDAPAGKAGLHEHDVILTLNGTSVESAAQLRRMIKETPSGRVVTLGISRDGQPLTLKVQLADRKKSVSWTPDSHEFNFQMPKFPSLPDIDIPVSVVIAHSSVRSGLMVENITPQLGDFFGVKDGNGVLVRSVEKGSRGEKAGFHAGDVVMKVNGQNVHDTSDFTHALRDSQGGTASITVMRERHEQTLTITLPPKKDSGKLLEDSLDLGDISAETELAIRQAQSAVAKISQADILEKAKQAELAYKSAQSAFQKRLEDQQKAMRDRQKMMKDQQQKLERELSGAWAEI